MTNYWLDIQKGCSGINMGPYIDKAVQQSQEARCEVQGHDYENCCTVFLQIYAKCKWCGKVKPHPQGPDV